MNALSLSTRFQKPEGPVLVMVMDGVGIGDAADYNAVHLASTPVLDSLIGAGGMLGEMDAATGVLARSIAAHGRAVGMPTDADMGNSEVGHNALGAGRVFDQGAALVNQAISSGAIFSTKLWGELCERGRSKTLHLMGLLSDGNVHAHTTHLHALVKQANEDGVARLRLHLLTDGRDVAPRSALDYLAALEALLSEISAAENRDYRIASGGGRMLMTMDRYGAEWGMVERGWHCHVLGEGPGFSSAASAIEAAYSSSDLNDQYIPPFVIHDETGPVGPIEDGDGVIFFNFRGDRAMEICQAFEDDDFTHFDRKRRPDVLFSGMMQYDGDLQIPSRYLVSPPQIDGPLGEYLCDTGLRSFAISETQKYGHVTYFWNGNKSGYLNEGLEQYVEIPSDLRPFDEQPAMKAREITDAAVAMIRSGDFDFGRINFPNGDMVGHTGVMAAAIQSVEVTDYCVGEVLNAVNDRKGIAIILADHGNADIMYTEKNGQRNAHTAHTLNPVPFIVTGAGLSSAYRLSSLDAAGLGNVASTVCNLLGYEAPTDYDASLICV